MRTDSIVLTVLLAWVVLWCIFKCIRQRISFTSAPAHLDSIPYDENIAARLNTIWNRDPRNWRDDRTGYKKCLVFLHAFDFQNGVDTNGFVWDGACRVDSEFVHGVPVSAFGGNSRHALSFAAVFWGI